MKSVIFTVTNDLNYDQRMHRICGSLADNGFKVSLIGRKRKNSLPIEKVKWTQKRLACFSSKSFFFYAEYNIRLFFYLLFHKVDIYCAVDLDTILPIVLVGKIRHAKIVYDAHEYFTEVPELEGRKLVRNIWHTVAKLTIPSTHIRYTVSGSLATTLKKEYGYPFEIIRNVPVLKEKQANEGRKEHCIIYFGAVNKGRGLELLIEAISDIKTKLIIAGDGDIFQEIKSLVCQKKMEDKVTFTGYLLPQEFIALAKNATIGYNLLDPSSKSYYYSLSNKFFSYMHAGLPSVSNGFPEYKKINEEYETSVLCDFDKQSLSIAINHLISDENFYTRLKNNNIEASKKFHWKNEEVNLLQLYHEL